MFTNKVIKRKQS